MNAYYGTNPGSPKPPANGTSKPHISPHCVPDPSRLTRTSEDVTTRTVQWDHFTVPLLFRDGWISEKELVPLSEVDGRLVFDPDRLNTKLLDPTLPQKVVQFLGKRCDDDPTYHARSIRINKGTVPTITAGPATYHRYYGDCEALIWEVALQGDRLVNEQLDRRSSEKTQRSYRVRLSIENQKKLAAVVKRDLPYRAEVKPFDLDEREVGIGVNVLTVLCHRNGEHIFPLHDRGKNITNNASVTNVGEAIGTIHVVPAGTFQHLTHEQFYKAPQHEIEFRLHHTVFREFCEELMNKDRLIRDSAADGDPYLIFRRGGDVELRKAFRFFENEKPPIFFLGCGLDPLTTKVEVLVVLLIDYDLFRCRVGRGVSTENQEGDLIRSFYPFSLAGLFRAIDSHDNLLPAGMGCIALAGYHFERIERKICELLKRDVS